MAIQDIKSKINDNKQEKERKLLNTALHLFTEKGIKKTKGKYKVIVDRKDAIKEAIKMATPKDIIVLAGKGHEPYQEINGVKYPYDERVIVKDIIG